MRLVVNSGLIRSASGILARTFLTFLVPFRYLAVIDGRLQLPGIHPQAGVPRGGGLGWRCCRPGEDQVCGTVSQQGLHQHDRRR